jgi:hypothetical protein
MYDIVILGEFAKGNVVEVGEMKKGNGVFVFPFPFLLFFSI